MADGTHEAGDGEGTRPPVGPSSSVASRAGKRRVDLPDGSTPTPKPRRTIARRPWWRRGRFWLAVIVVEVVAALVISVVLSKPAPDDDLGGGDQAQFCAQVRAIRGDTSSATLDISQLSAEFTRQADTFRRLSPVAPTSLRGDIDTLASISDELAKKAQAIQEHKIQDPSYLGAVSDLQQAQAEFEGRAADADAHLNRIVLIGCGIDLSSTTTTAPATAPSSGAPGAASTVPTTAPVTPPSNAVPTSTTR